MPAENHRNIRRIAAALLLATAASCGQEAPPEVAEPQRTLPDIKPMGDHLELLSTPDRKITFTANELDFRGNLSTRVLIKFYEGNFAELERLATLYREGMRTQSGIEKLGPFYWAFKEDMIVDRTGFDKRASALIREWVKQYPKSPAPYIAYATMFDRVARLSVDSKNGDTPSEQAFQEKLRNRGYEILTHEWEIVRTDPYAHGLKMALISAGAQTDETWEEAYEAAKREHPGRFTIYFDAASTSPGISDSLMKAAVQTEKIAGDLAATMGEDADVGYARVWWAAYGRYYGRLLFERGIVNWPRIKNGFFKIIEDYPEPWNLNTFARFSCIVGDAETLRFLAPAVRRYPLDKVWSIEDREYCILRADAAMEEIPLDAQATASLDAAL